MYVCIAYVCIIQLYVAAYHIMHAFVINGNGVVGELTCSLFCQPIQLKGVPLLVHVIPCEQSFFFFFINVGWRPSYKMFSLSIRHCLSWRKWLINQQFILMFQNSSLSKNKRKLSIIIILNLFPQLSSEYKMMTHTHTHRMNEYCLRFELCDSSNSIESCVHFSCVPLVLSYPSPTRSVCELVVMCVSLCVSLLHYNIISSNNFNFSRWCNFLDFCSVRFCL